MDPSSPGLPIVPSGGASLPDTPAAVLLDVANAGKAIILDQTTGEGLALSVATLLEGATGEATETAASGDWLVGDGAGGAQLASAAPGDVRAVLGVPSALQLIPLAGYTTTVATVDVAIGGAYFDPADYAITGRTTVLTLDAIGQVVSGVTGTLTLHNLTDAVDVATLAWTETSATRKTASVTLPGSAKVYELRLRKSGGATSDYAVLITAHVRITWS
jgi:hypothetical protein